MNKVRVFVTGATGMVGQHLIRLLVNNGYFVVGCIRQSSRKEVLNPIIKAYPNSFKYVIADITEPGHLAAQMSNCHTVIHTAACLEPHASTECLRAVNVRGTNNVLQAAIAAGAKQFIHTSSLSVITGETDRFGVDETHSLIYCREPYANSKIDAEKIVMAEGIKGRIKVTILRPGFIYGLHERTWMPRLIQAIKHRRAMLVGDSKKQTNVIYVENLCAAIESAILNPNTYGQIYNLTDGQIVTKRLLFDTICDELNMPRINLTIPTFAARLLVEMSTLVTPIAPLPLKNKLARYSRAAFRLVALNQGFDISKAERDLGYRERIPFTEGMTKTLALWQQ